MTDTLAGLQILLTRASAERDAAIAALRQTELTLAAGERQATQLDDHRDQYRERWGERLRRGESAVLVQCHQDFSRRLDQAIALQDEQLQHAQARVRAAREQVTIREQRVAAVRKLIERRQAEIERIAARREQRVTDEAAQRARRTHDSMS